MNTCKKCGSVYELPPIVQNEFNPNLCDACDDAEFGPQVGHAYRFSDGFVYWVTHQSRRGYFHLLWFNPEDGTWNPGARLKADRWPGGAYDAPAPQPGQTYLLMGPTGFPRLMTVPEAK